MHFENFTERDIPYETLAKYGLTHEMIDDLPESVMTKFLHGCYTPILPLTIKTDAEDIEFQSRIALISGANGEVEVILKPKIETSSLGLYTAEQQEELRNGKAIIACSPYDIKNNGRTSWDLTMTLSGPCSRASHSPLNGRTLITALSKSLLVLTCVKNMESAWPVED